MANKLIFFLILFFTTSSYCDNKINDDYSGVWMFTANGCDSHLTNNIEIFSSSDKTNLPKGTSTTFFEAVNNWLKQNTAISIETMELYGKVQGESTHFEGKPIYVEYQNTSMQSGTWATYKSPDTTRNVINFYTVTAGNQFAIYFVEPAQSSGNWTTRHLLNSDKTIPAISHFSAFTSTPIIEPGTLLLLTFGLLGIVFMRKRK